VNFGWYPPDHLAGLDCSKATVQINPAMALERIFGPLGELSNFGGMAEEPLVIYSLD